MVYEKIGAIIEDINSNSPVRNQGEECYEFKENYSLDIEELNKITSELGVIYEKINNPLKIVLMGEVKAGKSTIINSIVGEKVSYVDVVEATASIIEISHGFKEEAIIEKYENENISGSILEINNILENYKNDQDFFHDVKVIKMKKNINNLSKIHIVDTPGLETITITNAERTKNYIQESDVVIWVLNCNHLGQSDVIEKLEEVYDLGKPIICVANRIDEIDAEKEEIVEYIEDELGYMIESVIPMSGHMAYEGVINNNNDILEDSGFNLLIEALKCINSNVDEVQQKSILKSFDVQVTRDIKVHNRVKNYFEEINKDLNIRVNNFENYKNQLNKELHNKVNQWFENEFLTSEIDEILYSKDSRMKFENYLSNSYIQGQIDKFMNELKIDLESKWSKFASDEIVNHINNVELKHAQLNISGLDDIDLKDSNGINDNDAVINEAKKGAILGGKIGTAIAGYSAILGPSAAQVTLAGALGGVLPPLVLAGALIKGGLFLKNRDARENNVENIKEKLLAAKTDFKRKYFNDILDVTKTMNSNILDSVNSDVENIVAGSFKEMKIYDLNEFIISIDDYVANIEKLKKKFAKYWVIDTNVFIDEPNILELFDENEVVILSKQVLIELDNKKRDQSLKRNVQKSLDNINNFNNIIFDDIGKGALSRIYESDSSPDNYILNTAVKYNYLNTILITSDKNLLAKCKAEGINHCSLSEFKENKVEINLVLS